MLPHCTVHMRIKFSPNEKENHLPKQINFQAAPATHRMSACTYDPTRDVPKCCACHEIKSPRVHATLPTHAPRVHATPDSACTCDPLTQKRGAEKQVLFKNCIRKYPSLLQAFAKLLPASLELALWNRSCIVLKLWFKLFEAPFKA